MEQTMSRGNLIACGVVAVLVLIVGFVAYSYRQTIHVWKLDTTIAPELARSTLELQEGVTQVSVAKEAGALTVRYAENNKLFRTQMDPAAVLKNVGAGKEVRVMEHRTE